MTVRYEPRVRLIPVARITVLDPRSRGRKKFAQITDNIARLGLKRPVTVASAGIKNGEEVFPVPTRRGRRMKAKTVYDTAFGLKGRTVFAANRSPEQQPSPGSHLNRS